MLGGPSLPRRTRPCLLGARCDLFTCLLFSCVSVQFRYKKRVYKPPVLDEKQLAKLHTKVGGDGGIRTPASCLPRGATVSADQGSSLGSGLLLLGSTPHPVPATCTACWAGPGCAGALGCLSCWLLEARPAAGGQGCSVKRWELRQGSTRFPRGEALRQGGFGHVCRGDGVRLARVCVSFVDVAHVGLTKPRE